MDDPIGTTVNGERCSLPGGASVLLIDALREGLGLLGPKKSCELSVCGSCTVLIDNEPYSSCMTLAQEAAGREVTTVEGFGRRGELSDVQQAFIEAGAIQCGFCTPGFVTAVHALLDRHPNPDRATIQRYLAGNICRCTGYAPMLEAVERVRDRRLAAAEAGLEQVR